MAFCNTCGRDNEHHIVLSHQDDWSEVIAVHEAAGPVTIDGSEIREVLQCCGCRGTAYFHTSYFSEYTDFDGRPIPKIRRFPPKQERKFPEWISSESYLKEGHFVNRLLQEVYSAISTDSFAVAAMGVRALIELMMVEMVGDQRTIGKNISKFEQEGYVGSKQRKILFDTIEFGSAAIHRDFAPNKNEVLTALDIAETIAKQIYAHSGDSAKLGKRAPKRR